MKHPHCNRSLASHLFWCRGFAPTFFVVVVALFVVSVGSGFYFASRPDAALAPSEPVAVVEQKTDETTTSTESEAVAIEPAVAKPVTAPKPVQAKPVECGSGATADACMFEHITNCTSARGTLTDRRTGVRVEHVVGGLAGGICRYRSTIVFAPGDAALLEGLDVQCNLPKDQLLRVLRASDEEQLLQVCTGSYIDILRQARGMGPLSQ